MPLPDFNAAGDLPPGVHRATLPEVLERFGAKVGQRGVCTARLSHMINDDQELKATQERIARFQRWLAQMRQTARAGEFEAAAAGYRLEIERMQAEVLDYLLRPTAAHQQPQAA